MASMNVQAWFMGDSDADQRRKHHCNPPEYVDEEYIGKHGIKFWKVNPDDYENDATYNKVRADRGYNYEDEITITKEKLPNYEEKVNWIYYLHLHLDEEIRFCLDGSGYFDFRDFKERWVRMKFTKGLFFVLPAGIYHRFTLDTNNYVKAKRLFVGEPVWTPYNRPADEKPQRATFLESIKHLTED
ncbi:LOW QUALITY PROTEIN: 1,2-dihydroxy-3-keto-5-methylthiopentene dioxygenase [Strongylocentrotus purpuratus]|uniref:Acireductone dioxygenase n=1 Tax=Strongylocentrotus purpuratus TaxID=7668 RepID=A0A7M7N310_STRPU|nr:LOW QUALITY PROTEIN: 1,2-dihydroxy-3-keto-5-methylthiopentene dioxygenase [Strongylocentrotus purpuratus]